MRTCEPLTLSLTEVELAVIEETKLMFRITKVNCAGCNYCMPSPVSLKILNNFTYYNILFSGWS
ncbi:putative aldo/keto reductase-like oxidoreductase [Fontibacillus solani]|uniref:Putative aldo/keto reductase-like oxidoreductase n=1 Tax=Fontibacillus solani TaxID=1572857 RepID=A0A7W3SVH1_9BACL|nr:hypothetical protein [Fontibacillus solani]MBA9086875.1 putative aldo/keto reductase-like oxidoreductase [Fontibacillus solani]